MNALFEELIKGIQEIYADHWMYSTDELEQELRKELKARIVSVINNL